MESDDQPTPTVEAQIGRLTVAMMDFVQDTGLSELTVGGLVLAGRTESGRTLVLTRTTARDPFACIPMWDAARDLEVKAIRDGLRRLKNENEELKARLEDLES